MPCLLTTEGTTPIHNTILDCMNEKENEMRYLKNLKMAKMLF